MKDNICIEDFTLSHYRTLLKEAKNRYRFLGYKDLDDEEPFVLWRHDVDFSVHLAHRLATIENEEGVKATYFFLPHCEFYNLLEKEISDLVREINEMGHDIAIHFDSHYWGIKDEKELENYLNKEIFFFKSFFDVDVEAFSFHNTTEFTMACQKPRYAGLINVYSEYFQNEVKYCSDSNGYWRFERMYDVVTSGNYKRLQILTHPAWWQDKPMYPRQRIFKTIYGRFKSVIKQYDNLLEKYSRENLSGPPEHLNFLKEVDQNMYEELDLLWNMRSFKTLYLYLWRLHELQLNELCKAIMQKKWKAPATEVNAFYEFALVKVDGWQLFQALFNHTIQEIAKIDDSIYLDWLKVRDQLIHGKSSFTNMQLEEGAVFLCNLTQRIVEWSKNQKITSDY